MMFFPTESPAILLKYSLNGTPARRLLGLGINAASKWVAIFSLFSLEMVSESTITLPLTYKLSPSFRFLVEEQDAINAVNETIPTIYFSLACMITPFLIFIFYSCRSDGIYI
ncbi:hypothetical protein D3C81_1181480 [compost metagenome]